MSLKQPLSVKIKDPDLERILQQLRPFQRHAFDLATQSSKGCDDDYDYDYDDTSSNVSNPYIINTTTKKHPKELKSISFNESRLGNGRLLLCDEMGLGKSVTSLAIMMHYRHEWPLLILCPASLRHTWPAEIEKFLPGVPPSAIYVVQGFDDADFYDNVNKRKSIQIVVATYSLLQHRSASAKVLNQFQFQCIIADESHNLKQKNSQRTQLALPLFENAQRLVLLSGTPALARPVELWTQVYAIAPDLFGSYTNYTKRYCNAKRGRFGWDVNGLSNANELHSKLKQIMIRRLKVDVLDELPAKQRSMVPISISKPSTKRKQCEQIIQRLNETRKSIQDLVGEEANGAHFEARKLLMEAYQASGVAKADGVCDYLLDWLRGSGTQKVLIFAHHKAVLDSIEVTVSKEFKGAGHIRIDGTVNAQERAIRVKKFQSSHHVRVAILSVTAAGVGLTLTAASNVMFAELHWTPGVLAQAEDRCHRIGQRNAVHVMYLVCEDRTVSVDGQLWDMLGRKVNNMGRVVDGETNSQNMQATRAPADENGYPNDRINGQSVQDELQSFFAEATNKNEKANSTRVPVKGTILNFFSKQHQRGQQMKPQTKPMTSSQRAITTITSAMVTYVPSEDEEKKVQWDCNKCTFLNTRTRSSTGRLECEMCGAYRQEENSTIEEPRPRCIPITPHNEKRDKIHQSNQSQTSHDNSSPTKSKYQSQVIVIDDDDDDDSETKKQPLWTAEETDVIALDDVLKRSSPKPAKSPARKRLRTTNHSDPRANATRTLGKQDATKERLLLFSVSKNSGRIMIHYATNGETSLVSFDLEQILMEETVNHMMEARLNRKQAANVAISLAFDTDAIMEVVNRLDRRKIGKASTSDDMVAEVKLFITQYVALREIEKKTVKESGVAYSGANLRQELLLRQTQEQCCSSTTERYTGGAKEHAKSRMGLGTATDTDIAVLEGRLCAFCAGGLSAASRIERVISTYCSKECAEEGRLKRGGMYASTQIRMQIFALEGGVCRLCGIDANALYTRIVSLAPAERLNALCNANWNLPKSGKALERLLQHPKEGDFWQADHIKAVAEGGGGCGLENLRTLCVPCHNIETEKLRGRLKLVGPSNNQGEIDSSARQTDIRSMFGLKRSAK